MSQSDQKYLDSLRHSVAHLLAAAVMELWPKTKRAIGPSIENGFYFDFDFGKVKISEDDFPKIKAQMGEILLRWGSNWKGFERKEVSRSEAKKIFSDNKYKLELIQELSKQGKKLTLYKSGDYLDLCKGSHINNLGQIRHFELLSVAGAYWRGDEKNPMLARIYGTAWPTKKELDQHLWQLEEAKKRDHKKIGKQQNLFLISQEIGSGLPIFAPKGLVLRELIQNYVTEEKKKRGYQFVWTPHIAHSDIYRKSGHWQKYDAMFNPLPLDKEEYVLKPMNCPHHFQVYLDRPRSYKELPMRIAENGTCYRYEKSGVLNGLFRVRSVTIDDTHTFIRYSQTFEEINKVLQLILEVFKTFGFKKYKARISTRDPKNPKKYLGDSQHWERAEAALERAAKHLKIAYEIVEGEAAFYGPKIDMMIKDSIGREWQLSTVQLDYNQPKNFNMTYTDEHGKQIEPAILHIAVLGSLERFMGVLIEHYAGAFPTWLSPVQVKIISISQKHAVYAQKITQKLLDAQIRVELDDDNLSMQKRIRNAEIQKVPYILVVGDKEKSAKSVNVRKRGQNKQISATINKFIHRLTEEISNKQIT